MKLTRLNKLAAQYLTALKAHVGHATPATLQAAHVLGSRTVAMGMETLDLAKTHDHAVDQLLSADSASDTRQTMTLKSAPFFTEAILPLEKTHRVALDTGAEMNCLNQALELATSVLKLKQEILQRKAVEESLCPSEQTTSKLLAKSRQLLSALEEERRKISRELHDVVDQTGRNGRRHVQCYLQPWKADQGVGGDAN